MSMIKALNSQLIGVVDETHAREKSNKHVGHVNMSTLDLTNQLNESHARITNGNLIEKLTNNELTL